MENLFKIIEACNIFSSERRNAFYIKACSNGYFKLLLTKDWITSKKVVKVKICCANSNSQFHSIEGQVHIVISEYFLSSKNHV